MISIWVLIRWFHIMAAITWIGGMLFILLVLLPIIRPVLDPDSRALLVGKVGVRYGAISIIALIILLITGYLNGERRHVNWSDLTATDYGTRLFIKLALVGVIIVITLVHSWYGRRIVQMAELPDDDKNLPGNLQKRRQLHIASGALSAANLLLNVAVVWIAASLTA